MDRGHRARSRERPRGEERHEGAALAWRGRVVFRAGHDFVFEHSRQPGPRSDRLVGAWRLAWLEEPTAEGKVEKVDCTGMLVFTHDGHMSVQVMYRDTQAGTGGGPVQYAQGGYEASFGRYQVDEGARTFTFDVEGALVRRLIGQTLTRHYALSGTQLIVKPTSPNEHWRVAWEKR